jgi:phosphoesterase RecJ-like protein
MKTPANSAARVLQTFTNGSNFLITSHVSPDGDAIGSLLGIAHLLRAMGKTDITCVLEDAVPRVYTFLEGAESIIPPSAVNGPVDIGILIDAHSAERSGNVEPILRSANQLIVIDHHLVDKADGSLQFIDPAYAAAGEMVFDLFELAGLPLTPGTATCIYTALTTDTGNFRYSNTNARSHRIAAELIEAGVNVRDVTSRVIDTMSMGKYRLLQRILARIEFHDNGRVAHADVLASDLKETGALPEDIDGLINYLRNIEGVRLAMVFRETSDGKTKVSFRTQPDFNAAEICRAFGGGGHAAAAGASLDLGLEDARKKVFGHLRNHLGLEV